MLVAKYDTYTDRVTIVNQVSGCHRWLVNGKTIVSYVDGSVAIDRVAIRYPTKGTCQLNVGLIEASKAILATLENHDKEIEDSYVEFLVSKI